jgi:hypothetical protein
MPLPRQMRSQSAIEHHPFHIEVTPPRVSTHTRYRSSYGALSMADH